MVGCCDDIEQVFLDGVRFIINLTQEERCQYFYPI